MKITKLQKAKIAQIMQDHPQAENLFRMDNGTIVIVFKGYDFKISPRGKILNP